jgi:hypothetical protein
MPRARGSNFVVYKILPERLAQNNCGVLAGFGAGKIARRERLISRRFGLALRQITY